MPKPSPISSDVTDAVRPVWLNTYWVENALGLCEGIWRHAAELNVSHPHFFGLVAKYAVDSAVLGLCKLYDSSNPQYKKDTVLNLNEHLRGHLTAAYASRLDAAVLVELGASCRSASEIVSSLRGGTDFPRVAAKIYATIDEHMPRPDKASPLQGLFIHRNKFIAHQQQLATLTELVKEKLKSLPSLDEMEKLNRWAMAFCRLVVTLMSNETLLPHAVSARVAALNVIAKVLGKNFDQVSSGEAYQECENFYRRF